MRQHFVLSFLRLSMRRSEFENGRLGSGSFQYGALERVHGVSVASYPSLTVAALVEKLNDGWRDLRIERVGLER